MMGQDAPGRQRLSEAVKQRRAELGYAMDALPHGPGEVTLRRIEAGEPGGYRPKTLIQLDRSLGWNPGTSQAVLNGIGPDDPARWIDVGTKPGCIRMVHPDLPGQAIEVTELAAPHHARSGWRRVAETDPSPVFRRRYRHITESSKDPGLGLSVATWPQGGAVGPSTSSSVKVDARAESAAGIDPEVVITRDIAVQALLKYVEVLGSERHRANPAAIAAQHEVLLFVHRLLDLIPTPEHIEWPPSSRVIIDTAGGAPEQDGGD